MPLDNPFIESPRRLAGAPESRHSEQVMAQLGRLGVTHQPQVRVEPSLAAPTGEAGPSATKPVAAAVDQSGFMLGGIRLP